MYVVSTFLLDIYASENRALWIYFSWQAAMPASVSFIGTFPSSRYVNKPTGIWSCLLFSLLLGIQWVLVIVQAVVPGTIDNSSFTETEFVCKIEKSWQKRNNLSCLNLFFFLISTFFEKLFCPPTTFLCPNVLSSVFRTLLLIFEFLETKVRQQESGVAVNSHYWEMFYEANKEKRMMTWTFSKVFCFSPSPSPFPPSLSTSLSLSPHSLSPSLPSSLLHSLSPLSHSLTHSLAQLWLFMLLFSSNEDTDSKMLR